MAGGSSRRRSSSPTSSRRRSSSYTSSSPFPAGRTVTYRSDAAPKLEVEVDLGSKAADAMPAQRASPALPSKVYDCRSSVVLVNDLLAAGIIELEGGDGKLAYCYFRARDLVARKENGTLGERLPVGSRVKCNCWLLDEVAKVPYLASVVWTEGAEVPREVVDRILGLPDREDMEAYHRDSRDLAWQLSTNRRVKEDRKKTRSSSRERKRSPKREKRRGRSKEERREWSKDRSKASSSGSSRLKKEKRSESRETSRSSRGSRSDRHGKERSRSRPKLESSKESRERKRRSRDDSPKNTKDRGERGRSSGDPHRSVEELLAKNFPHKNEGRGLLEEGRKRRFSEEGGTNAEGRLGSGGGRGKLPPRPKMAIGRNVFGSTGEPDLLEEMGMSVTGRGRGSKVAIGRNVFNPTTPKRRRHSGGGGGGGLGAGDCPGLGFQGDNSSFRGNKKNSRWMRWQSLCRKKPGEEGDNGGQDEDREEGETDDEDDYRSTSRQSHQGSTRSRSPTSSTVSSQGHKVSVLTYHNEEVGVLVSANQELRVLFHISQVARKLTETTMKILS